MRSPFPGMDPYLEQPGRWRGFHSLFIAELAGALNSILPDTFAAVIEERVYVIPPGRSVYPDAMVIRRLPQGGKQLGTAAVLERNSADTPEKVSIWADTIREHFVEIRAVNGPERVLAVIEVLSPTNKTAKSVGWNEYLRKQEETLQSSVHLVEIDLLRNGEHSVAVPKDLVEAYGPWDYLVCLHDSNVPNEFSFWRCSVRNALPRIAVPLQSGYPDAIVDLQDTLIATYDRGAFDRRIDYRDEPVPPLSSIDAEWADALLLEAGLRGN